MISFKSSEIPLFNHLFLEIKKDGKNIVLIKKWGRNRGYTDIIRLKTDRTLNKIPVPNRNFPTNVFMGVSLKPDASRLIRAWWKEKETVLKLDQTVTISSSQGMRKIESEHIFEYRTETDTLVYTIQRNTRESGPPIQFFFKRKGTKSTYYHKNWNFGLFFEAKVATEISDFLMRYDNEQDCLLTAVFDQQIEGSIVIDGIHSDTKGAHLRWFIVSDKIRGKGVGNQLMKKAVDFCRKKKYKKIYLWTFKGLDSAQHLYRKYGFDLKVERIGSQWGKEVNEHRYELVIVP